jgi:hypothetical protein
MPEVAEVADAAELSGETESLEEVRAAIARFPEVYAEGDAAAVANVVRDGEVCTL